MLEYYVCSWKGKYYSTVYLCTYGELDPSDIRKVLREIIDDVLYHKTSKKIKFRILRGDQKLYNFKNYLERKTQKKFIIY